MHRLVPECPREYVVVAIFTLAPLGFLLGLAASPSLWAAIAASEEPAALVGAIGTWIGSVGTMAAAGIAIWIVRYQMRATRRASFERDATRIEARATLLEVLLRRGEHALDSQQSQIQALDAQAAGRAYVLAKLAWEALRSIQLDTATTGIEAEELLHVRVPAEAAQSILWHAQNGRLSIAHVTELTAALSTLKKCHRRLIDEAARLRGL